MILDHTVPEIDMSDFMKEDWDNTIYSNERDELNEEIPASLPTSLGKGCTMRVHVTIRVHVDSDHAEDQVTRRSRTGFLVYFNNALVYWTSKK